MRQVSDAGSGVVVVEVVVVVVEVVVDFIVVDIIRSPPIKTAFVRA